MALIEPPLWNSAHRPIEYRYTFQSSTFNSQTASGSNTRFATTVAFIAGLTVGVRVYIPSGLYAGNWVVVETGANYFILNVGFVGSEAGTVTPMANVAAQLWAGYQTAHEGYFINPHRKIADILAVPGLDGYVPINVGGFIKGLFKKVPTPNIGADFSMSVPFRLIISGGVIYPQTERYAVNGTFEKEHLATFDAYFKILNARHPIHFSNGVCLYSMIWPDTSIHGEHIFNVAGMEGTGNYGGLGFDALESTFTVG